MPRLLLFLFFCGFFITAQAQQRLAAARQRSYLTKVFRLTEAQTRHLYERGLGAARPDFFTVPVDSFPTDSARPRPLPPGYYLVAHTEGPELVYWLRTETNCTVEVLDNQLDLVLVVRDSLGHLLPTAQVRLRRRPVPYDARTHTFRRAGGGQAGLVAVAYGGRTTYHALEQLPGRGTWGRVWRRVVFGWPLGYATGPVYNLGRSLSRASQTSTGLVGLVRAPFSEDVRDERQRARENRRAWRWVHYLAFSQPRYRPTGDTLRLKARVLRRRTGRPYRRPLVLWLSGSSTRRLAELRPVRPGSYEYVLPLADTLGLRADAYARVYLEDRHGTELASSSFCLEDYELNNAHYALRTAEKEQRRGQPQAVYLRGTDSNELPLLDARVRLAVVPRGEPGPLPRRQVAVPDTLWTHTQALDPVGETRVNLPATIFPDVDFSYEVQAIFLSADNERHLETASVSYRRQPGRLSLALSHDSVRLRYDSLGQVRPHQAWLHIGHAGDNAAARPVAVQLPLSLPLDFLADSYQLTDTAGNAALLTLDATNAGLALRSDRTADSVSLAVDNPRQLPFWYFVYRGSRLRYRGYGTALQLRLKDASLVGWHVSLHYRWGRVLRPAEYTVGPPPHQLLVATDQPAVAYPGQKVKLGFTVTDERGRPVPDADLTAYAYTSKFESPELPELPAFQRPVQGRQSRRRFKLNTSFESPPGARRPLPWAQWRTRLGLDSLQFYQFLYPDAGLFTEYQPAPGGLTQVAPFVVDSGRVRAPIAVYIDGQPAYVHDVNQHDPYPLVADSGRHTLALRLPDCLVTLRDVYLRPQHKLTLSLDIHHPRPKLTVEKRPALLTSAEHQALSRSLVLIDSERQPGFTALRQGPRLRTLPNSYGWGRQAAGPFRPDSVLLRRTNGLRLKFLFEPLFVYTPHPAVLKMVSIEPLRFGSLNGSGFASQLPLADFALTEADVRSRLYPSFEPEALLDEPIATPPGQGRLVLRLPPPPDTARTRHSLPELRYVLLMRPGQPGYERLSGRRWLAALLPGRYQVAVLLSDSTCLAPSELAVVQPNGQTYFQLRWADRQPAGALSRRVGRLVRAHYAPTTQTPAPATKPGPAAPASEPGPPQPNWRTLRGQVLDYETEEGLPGVTILVKGTTLGISTAADGSFTLRVPPGSAALVASYIGYTTLEQALAYTNDLVFKLRADQKSLQEVVVVGYGELRRQSLTGAVSTISSQLQGRVAGVYISSPVEGNVRVTLRGTRSVVGTSQALLVVDGRIYAGSLADISPDDVAKTEVLKSTAAVALYGAQAANGVLIITTKGNPNLSRLRLLPAPALPTLPDVPTGDPRLALRRRFRDYAWWRPTLVTDAQGRASTDVVLPDDVTSWHTFAIGSDGRGRLGAATGRLRSFKGLLAELAGPRFLVAGDRAQVLGKVLNYRADTAQVTTTFQLGAQVVRRQARRVATSAIDTLLVAAPAAGADSVQVTFSLAQPSGYADGEQRSLPVLPAGTRERVGTFAVITAADTTVRLPLSPKLGEVTVHLESDALPTLLAEIQHLQAYAYLCNEQLASKLLVLLLEQRIRTARGEAFRGSRAVNFLIRKLQQGRPQLGGRWGTWAGAAPSTWVSAHAFEALLAAEQAGYKVELNRPQLQADLLRELDERLSVSVASARPTAYRRGPAPAAVAATADADEALRLLRLLHQLGAPADYRTYLDRLDRAPAGRQPLDRYLAATELRQQLHLPYQLDTLRRYRLRTELGGAFYADTVRASSYFRYLLPDRVGTTLLAYRVLRAEGGHAAELARIRAFLLGQRGGGYWGSTYQAAQLLATIGPDLLAAGSPATPTQVRLAGAPAAEAAGTISKFPFDLKLPAADALTLHKTGALPVYATAYQTRHNAAPEAVARPFSVATTFAGQASRQVSLRAGQPAELLVTVDVKAEARYVLLEVPIPAGCSYGPAPTPNVLETHRESLRHQVGIFLDYLPIGRHTFRVALQPRYQGQYTLNPARAELLYFPTKFGRTGSKQVKIQ